jgi:hypothetical protein
MIQIMATTAQRRQRKQVEFLRSVAREDRRKFQFEWNKRVVSWLYEINRRGALLRSYEANNSSADRVFEVVEQAERLIAACEVESMVGPETRLVLTSECCKIAARVYAPTMYRVVTKRWYDQLRTSAVIA